MVVEVYLQTEKLFSLGDFIWKRRQSWFFSTVQVKFPLTCWDQLFSIAVFNLSVYSPCAWGTWFFQYILWSVHLAFYFSFCQLPLEIFSVASSQNIIIFLSDFIQLGWDCIDLTSLCCFFKFLNCFCLLNKFLVMVSLTINDYSLYLFIW